MKKTKIIAAVILMVMLSMGTAFGWDITEVDTDGGVFTDIATDGSGNPHISYGAGDELKHAVHDGTAWFTETVETLDYGLKVASAIAIGPAGSIYISYADGKNDALKCAVKSDGSWTIMTAAVAEYNGCYSDIAINSSGNPVICYVNDSEDALYLVSYDGSGWSSPELIYDTDDPDGTVSLALASDDTPHVSFYDADNNRLMYAVKESGTWNVSVIDDSTSDLGQYSSIALDSADVPHISYYDDDDDDLKYATNKSGSWVCAIVDGCDEALVSLLGINLISKNVNAGQYSSIAIDSQDCPRISYYAEEDESIRVAVYSTGEESTLTEAGWTAEAVETGDVGQHSALALDAQDGMHISYNDYTAGSLKYAVQEGDATLVEISSIEAEAGFRQVVLRWETASEIHSAGFNVYRSAGGGDYEQVNDGLIAASGSATQGASYAITDSGLRNGITCSYILEEVDASGLAAVVGEAVATPRLIYLLK